MIGKALITLLCLAKTAVTQSAVLTFTRVPNPVTCGEPQAITYSTDDDTTPVSIILRKGPANNLTTIDVLTNVANGGQFIWTPRLSLPNGIDYILEIKQNDQVNYFGPLTVQGAVPASVSAYGSQEATSSSSSIRHQQSMSSSDNPTVGIQAGSKTLTGAHSATARPTSSSSTAKSRETQSSSKSSQSNGLSTGSAIGIGIAIAGTIALVTIVAAVYYRRRSKIKKPSGDNNQPSTDESTGDHGIYAVGETPKNWNEKDGNPISEFSNPIPELSTKSNRHELQGRSRAALHELSGN